MDLKLKTINLINTIEENTLKNIGMIGGAGLAAGGLMYGGIDQIQNDLDTEKIGLDKLDDKFREHTTVEFNSDNASSPVFTIGSNKENFSQDQLEKLMSDRVYNNEADNILNKVKDPLTYGAGAIAAGATAGTIALNRNK